VAAQPGCAARASAAAWRTSSAVALPTRVMTAPVAGSSTSSEPPIAGRHCAPNRRPRHIDSIRILGIGAFIPASPPGGSNSGFALCFLIRRAVRIMPHLRRVVIVYRRRRVGKFARTTGGRVDGVTTAEICGETSLMRAGIVQSTGAAGTRRLASSC
jgi:hypothetical protein